MNDFNLTTMLFLFLIFAVLIDNSSFSYALEVVSFTFPTFPADSCTSGSLICMGSVTAGNGYLSLTPELDDSGGALSLNSVGRVLYPYPVPAWPAVFTTSFTVKISPFANSSGSGDGMTFVIAQDHNPSPSASNGYYLGLFNHSTEGGVLRQLAVELDTYMNEIGDPDGDHIGIDTTSISQPVIAKSLNSTGIDLKSGREIQLKIDYDGYSKLLQIYVAYAGNSLISFINQSIEMSKTVPRNVFVGFTASTGSHGESHQVLNWVFTSVPLSYENLGGNGSKIEKLKTLMLILIPVVMGMVIVGMCLFPYVKRVLRRRKERIKREEDMEKKSKNAANAPKLFGYRELSKATDNFSRENLLGSGGFGSVYRGVLASDPSTIIAVKKISATSKQGEREYLAEICTIGRLRHKNIVQLQGWCHEQEHLLLVYEYMANGSLDRFIGKGFLSWKTRYNILTGLASALLYLHEESGNPVIHRDVKPNNIMLDSDYIAHLGDFGLARLLQNEPSVTTRVAGTPGYLAPEVAFNGKATPESDVYSFGMVVIEVVCGKRSNGLLDENGLVDYVWSMLRKNELMECVDKKLEGNFDEEQVKRSLIVGLTCSHPDSSFRPKIRKVVQIFMNPNEPLIELSEIQPTSVCVSVCSSSLTVSTNSDSKISLISNSCKY